MESAVEVITEAPQGVAFLPWVSLSAPLVIGRLRLLPYERGKAPGDLPHCSQESLDRVMSAYAGHTNRGVRSATLIEMGEWYTGMDVMLKMDEFFLMRNFIGMAALSKRRFGGHFGYCNFDTYKLVVQRFTKSSAGKQAIRSRRRDGSTIAYWSASDFAFQRPLHVEERASVDLDEDLLLALLNLPAGSGSILEAIREYAHANTDSPDVMPHVELVMMTSAFEWLLDSGPNTKRFRQNLAAAVADIGRVEEGDIAVPLREAWANARPDASGLLDAWAAEFIALRGSSAHGANRQIKSFVWPLQTHLMFAAMLFPLLLKRWCAKVSTYKPPYLDSLILQRIEAFIASDPMDPKYNSLKGTEKNPWLELDERCRLGWLAKVLAQQ